MKQIFFASPISTSIIKAVLEGALPTTPRSCPALTPPSFHQSRSSCGSEKGPWAFRYWNLSGPFVWGLKSSNGPFDKEGIQCLHVCFSGEERSFARTPVLK